MFTGGATAVSGLSVLLLEKARFRAFDQQILKDQLKAATSNSKLLLDVTIPHTFYQHPELPRM
jgi:hypothetical protein